MLVNVISFCKISLVGGDAEPVSRVDIQKVLSNRNIVERSYEGNKVILSVKLQSNNIAMGIT